ncbi:translocation/assembly module TamB domain-containing protein [Xylanibacter muris]|uniref:Translocation/assembly module TamB n=1 Tax=Xylanibacter muris TaxID=2736290 RepID=A0ABX2AK11_9BACT|nr:translocation/assembly module TamB domain-containing protein [Xylanibacter muris]NPD91493.1 translocation/assembly module TamB [Xylanibacter muris]
MKVIRHLISGLIWTVIGLYAIIMILLHIPAIQQSLGTAISSEIAEKLGTKVIIGRIDLGLLNRIIIDDVIIYDRKNKEMLKAARLSAKISLADLANGKITVNSAQIFSTKVNLYKTSAKEAPNYMFVIDSLSSKNPESKSQLNLKINSLIIRHGSVAYNRHDIAPVNGKFSPHHINLSEISANITLKALKDDSVNLTVKKLSAEEQSGLKVRKLSFSLVAGQTRARLENLCLNLSDTEINISNITAAYKKNDKGIIPGTLRFEASMQNSTITPADLAPFAKQLTGIDSRFLVEAYAHGTDKEIEISRLNLWSNRKMQMKASGRISKNGKAFAWKANIPMLNINEKFIGHITEKAQGLAPDIVKTLNKLGNVNMTAAANGTSGDRINANANIMTDIGNASIDASMFSDNNFKGNVTVDDINLQALTDNSKLGNLSAVINASGNLNGKTIKAEGTVTHFDYNEYTYSNIAFNGNYNPSDITGDISINDPNITFTAKGEIASSGKKGTQKQIKLNARLENANFATTNISGKWGNTLFSANLNADFKASSIHDAVGTLTIGNFTMDENDDKYVIGQIDISSGYKESQHYLDISSDFCNAKLIGYFDYSTIGKSIINFISNKLPTIPGLPPTDPKARNAFKIDAVILNTEPIRKLAGMNIKINKPARIKGLVNDATRKMILYCNAPDIRINEKQYTDGTINITSNESSIYYSASTTKTMDNSDMMDLRLSGYATDNKLFTSVNWNKQTSDKDKNGKKQSGEINLMSQFFLDDNRRQTARINVKPSHINVNNAVWEVCPSDITYRKGHIDIENFTIKHDNQHIIVNGTASDNPGDSIIADLKGIDVGYMLDLINFHSVEFSGEASGRAYVSAMLGNMDANAILTIDNFKFEQGRMGILNAGVKWNKDKKQIDINAITNDGPDAMTFIDGYVSPERNYIDLGINAEGTHIEFLNSFTNNFMENVSGQAKGKVTLAGPLNGINLTGQLVVNGETTLKALNCKYYLRDDTVRLVPNDIILKHAPIYDIYNNVGYVSGGIHHRNLSRLSYDIDIEADKLLVYNFNNFGGNTFYGTIFGSGDVSLKGRSGELNMKVRITPEENSTFVYNASITDYISDQEFIQWNDITPKYEETQWNISHAEQENNSTVQASQNDSLSRHNIFMPVDFDSDLKINFRIDCTPDLTIKLLMDSRTNDYITLNGNGALSASYYNKGTFSMFGTYTVTSGTYGITIQDIIKKNFVFNNGGTIVFQGNPYDAELNLQAVHTVNGVYLSDLNMGNSFSNNSTRVNCLMNIGGQPVKPVVSFDLDLPTVSTDEKQMIRNLINSEDEMNQQVIYLLGIGRFYPQGNNNATAQEDKQSQTSLAMQSLLSGTLSGQINNVLNTVIKSNNWNFGANISTGDDGWNNAEYEGLLSGRLLNNRLLINGQFGYRDNSTTANSSFVGDFDVCYLLLPNGNLALKVYNKTNDRYFTKSSLNTQGIGVVMKKDFNSINDLFSLKRKRKKK